jgi:PTS system ascorbate-specific IIA component
MIGLIILAQPDLALGLLGAAMHTHGKALEAVEVVSVTYGESPETMTRDIAAALARVDRGHGVLILTDIYGATHTNAACRLLERGRIELITGMNLPMLLKVLNYRELPLDEVIDKALSGGCGGIVCAANPQPQRETGA